MPDTDEGKTTVDPVCGVVLVESRAVAVSIHAGEVHCFCSWTCKQRFDADPETYLRKRKPGAEPR